MAGLSILSTTQSPWVLKALGPCDELLEQIKKNIPVDSRVIIFDTTAMSCPGEFSDYTDPFYNELIEKLELPDYFGRNLNALSECMADLEWLHLDGRSLVMILRDAELILPKDREGFEALIDITRRVGEEWSIPIAEGVTWDRPASPFHLVLCYGEVEAFNASKLPPLDYHNAL